jgi:hypothetical protein
MELAAVILARAIAFIETSDLNPRGAAFFPALVPLLVNRFGFQKYPQTPEDFNEDKGVAFEMGYTGGTTIDKITVWNNGIGIDLRSSTTEGKNILDEALTWLSHEAKLSYQPGMVKRWGHLSQITFFSDVDFDGIHPAFLKLGSRITSSVKKEQGVEADFRLSGLTMNFDRTLRQSPIAYFSVQRRADTPFDQGKFFSEAPLPTETHLEILQQLEQDLKG